MKYRIKQGIHSEGVGRNRVTYKKGEIVESNDDLVAMFPEKFVLVGKGNQATGATTEQDDTEVETEAAPPQVPKVQAPKVQPPKVQAPKAPAKAKASKLAAPAVAAKAKDDWDDE